MVLDVAPRSSIHKVPQANTLTRMRWAIVVGAVGLLAVVVLVAALNSGRSGGDKAELTDKLKTALEEEGIPQSLTDCTVRRLRVSLDNGEIERLYDSARGAREGTTAVLASPVIEKTTIKSMIECGKRLEKARQLNREELIEVLRGVAKPS
jgi:hypothetical protein